MAKTVAQEIAEFREAIKLYDSTDLPASVRRLVSEGFDVLGKVKNLDDEPATIDEVADAIMAGAGEFINNALSNRPLVRRYAPLILPMVVPSLVEEAAKYTDTVDKFWDDKIEPVLAEIETVIHEIRVDMMGS